MVYPFYNTFKFSTKWEAILGIFFARWIKSGGTKNICRQGESGRRRNETELTIKMFLQLIIKIP